MLNKFADFIPRNMRQYRMGFPDPIIDFDSDKYKVLFRTIHVSRAALYIGYCYLFLCFTFSTYFAYHYISAVSGQSSAEWIYQYMVRYIAQLLLAIALQVIIVVVMIHGVNTERKSLLIPYITFTSITVLTGCAKIVSDLVYLDKDMEIPGIKTTTEGHGYLLVSHVMGTMIQAWCLMVVWRCYGYLGERKIARQIREQMNANAAAFYYPEQFFYYSAASQPPPYTDTVVAAPQVPVYTNENSEKSNDGKQ